MYLDNLITAINNGEEALQLHKEAKKIFQDASMNLRDWISNSKFVNENTIPDDLMKERVTKVLGPIWNTKKLENIEQTKTKREVLATLASIFDPLGMITPVALKMKLFLQESWEKEKEWDERLSSEKITIWRGIMTDLSGISFLCFYDSSSKAYATAIYLRTIKNDKITVNLVFSKARNAPKKELTIPRLELMSVLIGTRSLRFVTKAMRLENAEKISWTDSQCLLQWIKNRDNISAFVRNRVTEIINETDVAFRYINTKHNAADIPTRGMSAKELKITNYDGMDLNGSCKTRKSGRNGTQG